MMSLGVSRREPADDGGGGRGGELLGRGEAADLPGAGAPQEVSPPAQSTASSTPLYLHNELLSHDDATPTQEQDSPPGRGDGVGGCGD